MMGRIASQVVSCGVFNSNTIIVMMIAKTPSLNASNRVLLIAECRSFKVSYKKAGESKSGMGYV
jgi:hypothetical protein